jgi:hypothetical protein
MPIVFARVELRGKPSDEIYEKLHTYMKSEQWSQHLPGYPAKPMPHAMYQANYKTSPTLLTEAQLLRTYIEANIWTKAMVLLIEEANWAQTAPA